jgi:hypothetical protein
MNDSTHVAASLSQQTIATMEARSLAEIELAFVRATANSLDPYHVRIHRALIDRYNPSDPHRAVNNFVMHPMDYRFGPGEVIRIPETATGLSLPTGSHRAPLSLHSLIRADEARHNEQRVLSSHRGHRHHRSRSRSRSRSASTGRRHWRRERSRSTERHHRRRRRRDSRSRGRSSPSRSQRVRSRSRSSVRHTDEREQRNWSDGRTSRN